MKSTLIVGSGITGLILAWRLTKQDGAGKVLVLEKSRGVGGRLATRRTDVAVFDHGAQFYHLQPPIESWHATWIKSDVSAEWDTSDNRKKYVGRRGMTGLAKDLATDLDILLNTKVLHLHRDGMQWTVHTDTGKDLKSDRIILTCPLPQSVELLRTSRLPVHPTLEAVSYAKALVLLIEDATSAKWSALNTGYLELNSQGVQSIADQFSKGISPTSAWTVTMTPGFSEEFFELTDQEILSEAERRLKQLDPSLRYSRCTLKKWRYSHPLKSHRVPFHSPQPGLFLSGDAFGGPSINGAIFSAEALYQHLSTSGY